MTLGMMATDVEQRIDFDKMRKYKLKRIQDQLAAQNMGAMLCFDPDNIRYATSTALGEWSKDKFVRWCLVPREGAPYLFEVGTAQDVKRELCPWIPADHVRPGGGWLRGANSPELTVMAIQGVVGRIKDALQESGVADLPLGVDIGDMFIFEGLKAGGLEVVNGWPAMWEARLIKCAEEVQIIETAAGLADGAYEYVFDKIRPGIRESEVVAEIYGWLLKNGCDKMTAVNCVSGPRANPHPHDFSDRMIRPGELVYIDIMSSYLGYATCYYRTFVTTRATQQQRDVYKKAYDWLYKSIEVVRPGITTADIANQWPKAEEFGLSNELEALGLCIGHGLGLSIHEKPFISRLFEGAPTLIQPGMHFALETWCGDGSNGARIEEQIIVTETGHKIVTGFPCEELMVCSPR
jgi:Xaa-Pro aminopeptidase